MMYARLWLLLLVAMLAAGCSDDSPPIPSGRTETNIDRRPARASFTISETDDTILGISPSAAHLFRLRIPIEVRETAGLSGSLSYVRLRFFLRGNVIEVSEMTAARISQKAGSNRIPANGSLALDLDFDFNADDFDNLVLTFGLEDDRGNREEREYEPQGSLLILLDVLEQKGKFQSVLRARS